MRCCLNVIPCDAEGKLSAAAEIPDYGKQYYIHVFAIDNADNISEEVIIPVGSAKINASVITDKDIYTPNETVKVTSDSEAVKFGITAAAELSIYDEDGNLTLVLANEEERYIAPDEPFKLEGSWIIPEIMAGKYTAEIIWKEGKMSSPRQAMNSELRQTAVLIISYIRTSDATAQVKLLKFSITS